MDFKLQVLVNIIVTLFILKSVDLKDIVWKTSLGTLIGSVRTSLSGYDYYAFEGIPFAKPPVGALRFKAPVLDGRWNGVLNATRKSAHCYSSLKTTNWESEDCLYLNVYTRTLNKNPTKNILFTIYGGGFSFGNTNQLGPEYVTDEEDLIYVNTNYRLNVFGFLSLKDPTLEIPGNAGAKDLITALQWIQKYIWNFGGDRNKVTIAGCSSGGQMVNLIMLHPLASTLFRHAISQSGSAVLENALIEFNRQKEFEEIVHYHNSTSNNQTFLDHLNSMSGEELHLAFMKLQMDVRAKYNAWVTFSIVTESPINNPTPFLLEKPHQLIQRGAFVKIPYLTSFTFQEGGAEEPNMADSRDYFNNLLWLAPKCITQNLSKYELMALHEDVKKFYYGDEEPRLENNIQAVNIAGDCMFLYPNFLTWNVMAYLTNFTMPIYTYYFNYSSPLNIVIFEIERKTTEFKQYDNLTCIHCDELGYLYNDINLLSAKYRRDDHETLEKVKTYKQVIMNFIRTGNPKSQDLTNPTEKFDWKPLQSKNLFDLEYLVLEYPHLRMERLSQSIFAERVKYWSQLVERNKRQCTSQFAFWK